MNKTTLTLPKFELVQVGYDVELQKPIFESRKVRHLKNYVCGLVGNSRHGYAIHSNSTR